MRLLCAEVYAIFVLLGLSIRLLGISEIFIEAGSGVQRAGYDPTDSKSHVMEMMMTQMSIMQQQNAESVAKIWNPEPNQLWAELQ